MSLRSQLSKISSHPKFQRYKPKKGHVVQTIRGPRVAGQIIKIHNKRSVDFKSANGKIYRAHIHNVRRAEAIPYIPEGTVSEEQKIHKYHVIDRQTKSFISGHPSLHNAHRKADKLDNAYGGYRYAVQPNPKHPDHKVSEEMVTELKHDPPALRSYVSKEEKLSVVEMYSIHHASAVASGGVRTIGGFSDKKAALDRAVSLAKERRKTVTVSKGGFTYHHVSPTGKITATEGVEPVTEVSQALALTYLQHSIPQKNSLLKRAMVRKKPNPEKDRILDKRNRGIANALAKFKVEEVEPVQEMKRKLVDYISSAAKEMQSGVYLRGFQNGMQHKKGEPKSLESEHKRMRREKGIEMAAHYLAFGTHKKTVKTMVKPAGKSKWREAKEEVVTELQKPTLRSYIQKAKKDFKQHVVKAKDARAPLSYRIGHALMALHRHKGILAAKKKLAEGTVVESGLDKSTLRSYIGRSLRSAGDHYHTADSLRQAAKGVGNKDAVFARAKAHTDIYKKRMKGVGAAKRALLSKPKSNSPSHKKVETPAPVPAKEKPAASSGVKQTSTPAKKPESGFKPNRYENSRATPAELERVNSASRAKPATPAPKATTEPEKPKRVVGALRASLQAAQQKAQQGNQ